MADDETGDYKRELDLKAKQSNRDVEKINGGETKLW